MKVKIIAWSMAVLLVIIDYFIVIMGARPWEECITGMYVVNTSFDAVVVGDQQICGYGLKYSAVTGPSKFHGRLQ